MGLFNDMFTGMFGGGGEVAHGYEQAQEYLEPWQQAGQQAMGDMSGYLGGIEQSLSPYGQPADYMYSQINQAPQDFYQNMMGGYEQSPQYQQQMTDMERAMVNAGAASGMTGSGAFYDNWQRNAQDITAQDQQRWFENMLRSSGEQQSYLNDFRGQQNQYLGGLGNLSAMGLGAAGSMGDAAIGQGRAEVADNPWGNVANLAASGLLAYYDPAGSAARAAKTQ